MDYSNPIRKSVLAAIALAFATLPMPSTAFAFESTTPLHVLKPDWTIFTADRFSIDGFYPDLAYRLHVGGYSVVRCRVEAGGVMDECIVLAESPIKHGFGEAGLRVVRQLRLDSSSAAVAAVVDGHVDLPIGFGSNKNVLPPKP